VESAGPLSTIYASLTTAMIIPATTNTTIATCIHIHVGDMRLDSVPAAGTRSRRAGRMPK
jgi:hypothetical protein